MGIQEDADLDWILPNRYRFDKCNDLFHDTDLFTDGACTCSECSQVTWAPTSPLTPSPTASPTLPTTFYEAEDQTLSSTNIKSSNPGYFGTGYADMGGLNSYIEFSDVDGDTGGLCRLTFRYTQGGHPIRPCTLMINGQVKGELSFPGELSWEDWKTQSMDVECAPGSNVIRLTVATGDGGPNVDRMGISLIGTLPPTTSPSKAPSASPITVPPTSTPSNAPTTRPTAPVFGEFVNTIFSKDSTAVAVGCTNTNSKISAFALHIVMLLASVLTNVAHISCRQCKQKDF